MIAYIRGRVLSVGAETVIVDVNGLGYELYCSGGALNKCVAGEQVELYTYLQVKEDGISLFGFASLKEKEVFLKVLSVQGVGPKLGISVLTGLSVDDFTQAVLTADVKRLSAVKGLGKKTAEKIVLELHGAISAMEIMHASGETEKTLSTPVATLTAEETEAVDALMGLGFTKAESMQAVKRAKDAGAKSVEDVIRRALQGGI